MKTMRLLGILLATSIGAARADTPTTQPSKADIDKWLVFFDKIVATVVANKDDCDKMATQIESVIDANSDVIAKANEAQMKNMQLPKEAEDHMSAGMQKMMDAMQKCGADPKVQAAFGKMKGPSAPAPTTPPQHPTTPQHPMTPPH
jgi:hypothetical protein